MAGQQLTERQKIVLQLAQFLYHEGPEKISKVSGIPVHQVRYDRASVEQPRELFELEEEISRTFADFVESVTIVSRREEVKGSDFPTEDFE